MKAIRWRRDDDGVYARLGGLRLEVWPTVPSGWSVAIGLELIGDPGGHPTRRAAKAAAIRIAVKRLRAAVRRGEAELARIEEAIR